jgi:hypothetical protein
MAEVSWSRHDGQECIRVVGPGREDDIRVRVGAGDVVGQLPAMAGCTVLDGDDVCFIPRFGFLDGTSYAVAIDGVTETTLRRPAAARARRAEVLALYPSTPEVPRNLLRFYVSFSTSMSEGFAADHVRLVDGSGQTLVGAVLPTEYELWDRAHRRLTVLLDPARIKRGLVSHRHAGYPLQVGLPFRLVVDEGFLDAHGAPLRSSSERAYRVGPDERRHVEPAHWTIRSPAAGSLDPLEITFERPLDHGLLGHCLRIVHPTGGTVNGTVEVGSAEASWQLVPDRPWIAGSHALVVDHILEDRAGNSLSRVFDQDRSDPVDARRTEQPFIRTFSPV